jgi:HK97 family phage prohead protease
MVDMGNVATAATGELNTAAKRYCLSQGWAMPPDPGSYPIRPANMHGADDVSAAVKAVGRGNANPEGIRKFIMGRAKAIGASSAIPDTWSADGTLAMPRSEDTEGEQFRSFPWDMELRSGGDGRTLVGYAVPFDQPQDINDRLTEAFDRGAFNHQLPAMNSNRPVPYYGPGHKREGGPQIGHIALARVEPRGLYTETRVAETPAGDNLLALVRNGSVPDQSIGFTVGRSGTERRNGVAWRTRANLTELAAVPVGAYADAAGISGVRSATEEAAEQFRATGHCDVCGHIEDRAPAPGELDNNTRAAILISGMKAL